MIRRWMPLLEVLWLAVLAFLNAGSALALMVEQRFPRRQP